MTMTSRQRLAVAVVVVATAGTVSSCAPEYRGYNSGIDAVLWRQVASFEDPLSARLYAAGTSGPTAYLETLEDPRWDGRSSSAANLDVDAGGVILYGISSTKSSAEVSASSPRVHDQTCHAMTAPRTTGLVRCIPATRWRPNMTRRPRPPPIA